MQLLNIQRSSEIDKEMALVSEDRAIAYANKDRLERIRKQRGELADRRLIERANKEVWQ